MLYALRSNDSLPNMGFTSSNAGFIIHALIEIPAAINFMLSPSKQLGKPTPHAHAIIRQYALLLLSSVLIALVFASRPADELSRYVAGALAIYHIGPAIRSCARLSNQASNSEAILFSEAFLYLICHLLCGFYLALTALTST